MQKCPRNRTMNKKCSNFEEKDGLNLKLKQRKAQKSILSGSVVTRMGERKISTVFGRLLDNLEGVGICDKGCYE